MRPRTTLSIAALAAMVLLVGYAGEAVASGAGIKTGLAFAKQDYSYADPNLEFDNSYRKGFSVGVFIEQSLVPSLAVRAEGLFVRKGFKVNVLRVDYTGEPIPQTTDLLYGLDYITLNLLGKLSLPTRTYLLAGPRLDERLNSGRDEANIVPSELEDKFSSTTFGWPFGIGQEVPLATTLALFIEGQLYVDQGYLYEHAVQGTDKIGTLASIRNKAFALFAGVRF
mgnify:CR=1 FL=1